ncbi:DUF2187 domain-containing protein [Ornithinibacillus sp. L9]|uniref:DUF2187 domain-containing protein n=1 Tax=Ornithinibacillus caprae TaxID=2678566 RepID=A0A6N8FFE2_9BACI|nr:DUF2187 family protein [Ornithinibacillus caprae]MUK88402.1 DUF2187 domain-containing protein [Ornithinibacillus caprae]
MTEENTVEQRNVQKADEGDTIQVTKGEHKGTKGKVLTVRDNTVIIEMGTNPKTGEPIKTVVNHKKYKILK